MMEARLISLAVLIQFIHGVPMRSADGFTPAVDRSEISQINQDTNSTWYAEENDVFTGMTLDDVRQNFLGLWEDAADESVPVRSHSDFPFERLPKDFNAYEEWPDFMHSIRSQQRCGSCWAFAASEVLSDRFALASNGTINNVLSPEELVSCDKKAGACHGGGFRGAWQYMQKFGLATDSCFPYTAGHGKVAPCTHTCADGETLRKYRAADFFHLRTEEAMMAEILLNGPIEAGFTVYRSFLHYKGGVFQKLDDDHRVGGHAIKVVGWGTEPGRPFWHRGTKYWLCANSWGPRWGLNGFFKIRRGLDAQGKSECNIQNMVYAGTPDLSPGTSDVVTGTSDVVTGTLDVVTGTSDVFTGTSDLSTGG